VSGFDYAAIIDDGDAVAEALGFFNIMRGEQNGLLSPF